jgi:hypothetical protein
MAAPLGRRAAPARRESARGITWPTRSAVDPRECHADLGRRRVRRGPAPATPQRSLPRPLPRIGLTPDHGVEHIRRWIRRLPLRRRPHLRPPGKFDRSTKVSGVESFDGDGSAFSGTARVGRPPIEPTPKIVNPLSCRREDLQKGRALVARAGQIERK